MNKDVLLTDIHLSEYNANWKVESSAEFDEWFKSLDESSKESIQVRLMLLSILGPHLKRPYSDVLKGSKQRNLKELRAQSENHVLRVAYYFDSERNAFVIIGGDKKGINQKKFYQNLIKLAEKIIERHEKEIKK